MTMSEFLDRTADQLFQPVGWPRLAWGAAVTVVVNIVTIPLGRVAWVIPRAKSRAEIKAELESKIYSYFDTKAFEDSNSKALKKAHLAEYVSLLDSLDERTKMNTLKIALERPEKYAAFLDSGEWRSRSA